MSCVFCLPPPFVLENELACAFFDKYPVNEGHLLIIPKRHVKTYFDCTIAERMAMDELLLKGKDLLDERFKPTGYNVGINCHEDAGQTVFHCHMHLIPRYKGDVDNPTGGVRGVIPNKRMYEKEIE